MHRGRVKSWLAAVLILAVMPLAAEISISGSETVDSVLENDIQRDIEDLFGILSAGSRVTIRGGSQMGTALGPGGNALR